MLEYIHHEKIKKHIYKLIKENHSLVLDKIKTIETIISFYRKNNLINKSEIGKFFIFYENEIKSVNVNSNKNLLELFYKLITYDRCLDLLKECFYIFSDYRSCIYFMTPSIDYNNTEKKNIDNVVNNFKNNINTLNQIISKVYIGQSNPWGSPYYSSAYSMFDTLLILKKYYKDPLDKINIKFKINKICPKNSLIKNLYKKYNDMKPFINVSQFLINLKKLGYDLWHTIPLIFNTIFEEYELSNILDSLVFGDKKIYFQKMNNKLGIMSYILVDKGYISNINIFQNFND
jgi:hypothetical protein